MKVDTTHLYQHQQQQQQQFLAALAGDSIHKPKPSTLGEELFLIHLRRDSHMHDDPDEDDDIERLQPGDPLMSCKPPQRKRAKSIGEELYEVHVKRSQGLPPDYDNDADISPKKGDVDMQRSHDNDGVDLNKRGNEEHHLSQSVANIVSPERNIEDGKVGPSVKLIGDEMK